MRHATIALAALACAALLGVSAAGADTWNDPAGDSFGMGLDITAVTVTNDDAGTIMFDIAVPIGAGQRLWIDTDSPSVITADSRSIMVDGISPGVVNVLLITFDAAGQYVRMGAPSLRAVQTATDVQVWISKADLGVTDGFHFSLITCDLVRQRCPDHAPDYGSPPYAYTLTTPPPPPVVTPVIHKPTTVPAKAVAGKRFTVTFAVTRSDDGTPLTTGTMVCDPKVAGRMLRHTESFANGKARLSFVIPKAAKGKTLRVNLTIRAGDQSATTVRTFRIR